MQLLEQSVELSGMEQKRVETVVETLETLRDAGETFAEVAHDARNMVTALGLFCDLLDEPGVLTIPFVHYGGELRLVAKASSRLVERLVALDTRAVPGAAKSAGGLGDLEMWPAVAGDEHELSPRWDLLPAVPIDNLAGELLANRNLLAALVGPAITLTVNAEGGALPVRLMGEDLTRILVNLVKNAAEAIASSGRIAICLHEFHSESKAVPWLVLTVDDSGSGIPRESLDHIFESEYSTRSSGASAPKCWPGTHRGLGLSITRSILEAAGGRIHAANRDPAGARFVIELPARAH